MCNKEQSLHALYRIRKWIRKTWIENVFGCGWVCGWGVELVNMVKEGTSGETFPNTGEFNFSKFWSFCLSLPHIYRDFIAKI